MNKRESLFAYMEDLAEAFFRDFNFSSRPEVFKCILGPVHSSSWRHLDPAFPNSASAPYKELAEHIKQSVENGQRIRLLIAGIDGFSTNPYSFSDLWKSSDADDEISLTFVACHNSIFDPGMAVFETWDSSRVSRVLYGTYELKEIAETVLRTRVNRESELLLQVLDDIDLWKLKEALRPEYLNTASRNGIPLCQLPNKIECRMCLYDGNPNWIECHFFVQHFLSFKCRRCTAGRVWKRGRSVLSRSVLSPQDASLRKGSFETEEELVEHKKTCTGVNIADRLQNLSQTLEQENSQESGSSLEGSGPVQGPAAQGDTRRSHVCPTRGKAYMRMWDLRRHCKTHTSPGLTHACPREGCDKTFSRRDSMKRHMRKFCKMAR